MNSKRLIILFLALVHIDLHAFPTVCSVIDEPYFEDCLSLSMHASTCGFPPRPCAHFSYYVPRYFVEVVPHPQETFFSTYGATKAQLLASSEKVPFGSEDDGGAFSFHAHTLNIPFAQTAFSNFPCGGELSDLPCLTSASEHLGMLWSTGKADFLQPKFLAWQLSPKACLLYGAAKSIPGINNIGTYPYTGSCSFDRSAMAVFPPSAHEVCSGWGIHFPRSGTTTSSDQTTASMMIASRMRSLGSDVFNSVPAGHDEKWQMILPHATSCFREGQNIGMLALRNVNDSGRLRSGQLKKYLYAVWSRTECTRDVYEIVRTKAALFAAKSICRGKP